MGPFRVAALSALVAALSPLAAGCVGGGGGGFGSSPSHCTPASAALDSIAIEDYGVGHPAAVGDSWVPGTGGQGLTMSHFTVLLTGTVPDCLQVTAMAEHAVFDGPQAVLAAPGGGSFDLLIGPVDDTYDIDVTIDGASAHVGITGNVVTDVH